MKKSQLLVIILITICIGILPIIKKLEAHISYNERAFFVEEKIVLKGLPPDVNNLRIWIPYPLTDRWQEISDFKLEGPFEYNVIVDKTYGNRIIYLKQGQDPLNESTAKILLSFKAKRKEYGLPFFNLSKDNKNLSKFLKPNRLVPVNGRIKALAEKITRGKKGELERVRAIYDYIIEELSYFKGDPKICGIGDSLLTLEAKKGICTDYHSLFISLVRSLGIPAKFEIGFPVPEGVKEHSRGGYHCWAKFYVNDKGWIPVDISEADKHPEKKDYFFGHIDENRIHLTTGRDIKLAYAEGVEPLNFFIYPYAELNGLQFYNIDFEITFRDLKRR